MMTFQSRGREVVVVHADGREERDEAPDALARLEKMIVAVSSGARPGAASLLRRRRGLRRLRGDGRRGRRRTVPAAGEAWDLPDMYFIITDAVLVFDHVRRNMKVVVNTMPGDDAGAVL